MEVDSDQQPPVAMTYSEYARSRNWNRCKVILSYLLGYGLIMAGLVGLQHYIANKTQTTDNNTFVESSNEVITDAQTMLTLVTLILVLYNDMGIRFSNHNYHWVNIALRIVFVLIRLAIIIYILYHVSILFELVFGITPFFFWLFITFWIPCGVLCNFCGAHESSPLMQYRG